MTDEYDREAIASMQAGWAADQGTLRRLRDINADLLARLNESQRLLASYCRLEIDRDNSTQADAIQRHLNMNHVAIARAEEKTDE